ncbi:unnamed protein product [marine sediment metagenome]|uniref:Uncharacterized protein n=1 Tax=marine sediment metagenome TaxID=412755 RepID=X1M3B0_9ZZZZ
MTPSKAREIIQLNIDEASPKMPPDVKTALIMGAGAIERLEGYRKGTFLRFETLLPGETAE